VEPMRRKKGYRHEPKQINGEWEFEMIAALKGHAEDMSLEYVI